MVDKKDEKRVSSKAAVEAPEEYRALVDLRYKGKTVEAGEVVSDIPEESVGWLLDGNYIERVN